MRENNRNRKPKHEFLEFFSDAGDFDEEEKRQQRKEERIERRQQREQREQRQQRERRGQTQQRPGTRRRRKSSGPSMGPVLVTLFFVAVFVIVAVLAGRKLMERWSYSKETMELTEYYKITGAEDVPVIMEQGVSDLRALQRDGNLYLPLDFVQARLNSKFFYDKKERVMIYTTPTQIYVFPENSAEYQVDGESKTADTVLWVMRDEMPQLEIGFLEHFSNFIWQRFEDPLRLTLSVQDYTQNRAEILKDTQIRYQGGIKSDVLRQISAGEKVAVLETMEEWSKVKSEDGIVGYVENKKLSGASEETVTVPINITQPEYPSLVRDHKINMAWHQVTSKVANDTIYDLLANTQAVNVVSPTWYFLSDNEGGFTSIESGEYVSAMHDKGIEVWALIDNFTNDVDTTQILSSLTNRQRLISALTQSVVAVGADGINVDFELVPREAGEDYVEFIRELSIACRKNNLVLSVDNYVPTEYTDYYNRKEQGQVVDYVVIMGYDEHYGGSQEAGSVASLGYVQQGIEKTIADVPAQKVINGIPFYTRLWRSSDAGVESEALTMPVAKQAMETRGITPEWDETTSQYYAAFEEEGKQCQIWMEESESIRAKLRAMSQFNLGGVAEWKLGQELPVVWDEIAAYMNGSLQ